LAPPVAFAPFALLFASLRGCAPVAFPVPTAGVPEFTPGATPGRVLVDVPVPLTPLESVGPVPAPVEVPAFPAVPLSLPVVPMIEPLCAPAPELPDEFASLAEVDEVEPDEALLPPVACPNTEFVVVQSPKVLPATAAAKTRHRFFMINLRHF
jgi:hypothetical protein